MTRLIVWRHGRTSWNAGDRIQGQLDTELDETGVAQVEAAAPRLAALDPVAIVASDLRRAADTAAALARLTGLPVRHDRRLRERDFGAWQGLTGVEARARYPAEYARWQAGEPVRGCGVEEIEDFAKRAASALLEAAAPFPDGTVVVACHGGTAKYGTGGLLGWPPEVLATIGSMTNAHWVDLRSGRVRGWRMHGYNIGV